MLKTGRLSSGFFEGRELVQDFLETFYRQWQTYASFLMSKPLKEFLAREAAFEEGRLPLVDWTVSLKMAAVRYLKLDLDNVLEQKDGRFLSGISG